MRWIVESTSGFVDLAPEISNVFPSAEYQILLFYPCALSVSNAVNMSSRAGLRLHQFSKFTRASLRKPIGQRSQTTDAAAAPSQSNFQRLWNSPIGVKTVHFWYAPDLFPYQTANAANAFQGPGNEGIVLFWISSGEQSLSMTSGLLSSLVSATLLVQQKASPLRKMWP